MSSPTILLVEDEIALLKALKITFVQEQYTVHTATNGSDALLLLQKERPDVILLDIIMPQMNGMTFLKELSNLLSEQPIPIFLLTNLSSTQEIMNYFDFPSYSGAAEVVSEMWESYQNNLKEFLNDRLNNSIQEILVKSDTSLEKIVEKVATVVKK